MAKKNFAKKEKLGKKAKKSGEEFNKEIKKAVNTAVVAAFGFLMALAWRDVITEYLNQLTSISPVQGKLISALIITIISVLGILVVTKLFYVKE